LHPIHLSESYRTHVTVDDATSIVRPRTKPRSVRVTPDLARLPHLSFSTVRSSGYCGHRAVPRIERILHKGGSSPTHKCLFPKSCSFSSLPITHHRISSFSHSPVAALSSYSGLYQPIPRPAPRRHASSPSGSDTVRCAIA